MSRNRVASIDVLKYLCAFAVVIIHKPFPGLIGSVFLALARVAVPIFFTISGYFNYSINDIKKLKNSIVTTFKLIIYGSVLMLVCNLIINVFIYDMNACKYLCGAFTSRSLFDIVFKNKAYICGPYWYLYAYVEVLFIDIIACKLGIRNKLCYVLPILFIVAPILGKYSNLILNCNIDREMTRNFLFTGLPYYYLGISIHRLKENNFIIFNMKFKWYLIACGFISLITIVEGWYLQHSGIQGEGDLYFSTAPLVILIFLLFQKIERLPALIQDICCKGNGKSSTFIYIVHPAIASVLEISIVYVVPEIIWEWTEGIMVFLISAMIAYFIYNIKDKKGRKALVSS